MSTDEAEIRRDDDGNPYWTFVVDSRHLIQTSRVAFPRQVARALGCRPQTKTLVAVDLPPECEHLSVEWQTAPTDRAIIANLAEPLRRLRVANRQLVNLVITGSSRVELRPARGSKPPTPWGSPPTPILPDWHLKALSAVPVPHGLRALLEADASETELRVVSDLGGFWESRTKRLDIEACRVLLRFVERQRWPPRDHVVVSSEADLVRLLECPLRRRARNCISSAVAGRRLDPDRPVTVGWLLSLHNFGFRSLLEVMSVAEAAGDSGFLAARPPTEPDQAATSPEPSQSPDPSLAAWSSAIPSLGRLLTASAEFYGARTLTDALTCDLGRIISELHMEDSLNGLLIRDLADGRTFTEEAVSAVTEFWEALSPTQRVILIERVLAPEPQSLEEIGRKTSLSRERIRQIQKPLEARLRQCRHDGDIRYWVSFVGAKIRHHVGPIATEKDLEERIARAFPDAETAEADNAVIPVARQLLRRELGYTCDGAVCLDRTASEVVKGLKDSARSIADDTGLIDESELRHRLPHETWHKHWDVLIAQSGLHRLGDRLALRDTAKARAKAALLTIGRNATKSEIAQHSGLDPARIAGALAGIQSVARADKTRWGLRDWIDDVYEGIPAEIVQRIEEDGGSARLNRLLDELPRLFGVSEMSVRAYVATPAFRVEHGWVSIAEEPDFVVGRFKDVASGRDSSGDLYWAFPMHERYLRGFSVVGVPPELAVALGCEFGRKSTATVRSPQGCRAVSVNWRKTALTGPEIGRVGDSMESIGAREGDLIRLVIHTEDEISFTHPESIETDPDDKDGTGHRISPIRSLVDKTQGAGGPYLGVRTGVPIAARLKTSTQSSTTSRNQGRDLPSQPPAF